MKGKIQTVLGPIDPEQTGRTLTHEHLLHELPKSVFKKSLPPSLSHIENADFTMENLGWIRQYPYCFKDNNEFADAAVREAVQDEMHFFKRMGGSTIVEVSSIGLRARDHSQFMKTISQESGVNIILGTGYYVAGAQSETALNFTIEEMEKKMKDDITEGINGTDAKCGVIGEIGCSWPLLEFEKKSLRASASVQEETGCPVIIHPGRCTRAPQEIIRIFQEAGGRVSQTTMSHLDRTLFTKEALVDFASLGSFCEFDLFGTEVSHYQHNETIDMPSDAQRVARLHALIEEGYGEKILVAQDIHTKHRLMKFGGHGYSHIFFQVVPKMLKRGFTENDVQGILVSNPRRWLTFQ